MRSRPGTGSATTAETVALGADGSPIAAGLRTRFAPAPTGHLHLGHVANAVYVWGVAGATRGSVLLRIEDHDRQRSRASYRSALLEDLEWLGFRADEGPVRQSDDRAAYAAALETLRAQALVYVCDCSRAALLAAEWRGPGCPGRCRERALDDRPDRLLRARLGGGDERWMDLAVGPCTAPVAVSGDLPVRDRNGNWTYGFAVVVDDLRHGIGLVIRGRDLLEATAVQIRLARLLGRPNPPAFLHHRLIRRPDGSKLSKADGDTSVRELRTAGAMPAELIGRAAAAVGLVDAPGPIDASEVAGLFRP